jgi:hypothetical protein
VDSTIPFLIFPFRHKIQSAKSPSMPSFLGRRSLWTRSGSFFSRKPSTTADSTLGPSGSYATSGPQLERGGTSGRGSVSIVPTSYAGSIATNASEDQIYEESVRSGREGPRSDRRSASFDAGHMGGHEEGDGSRVERSFGRQPENGNVPPASAKEGFFRWAQGYGYGIRDYRREYGKTQTALAIKDDVVDLLKDKKDKWRARLRRHRGRESGTGSASTMRGRANSSTIVDF